ncbi:MAG TPA: polysaccharide deacetylase family protein [Longimicrobiales bacterium]|nr:polysaccharide deacetylase family protein [Longimicrobiales bacterium]
MNLAAAASGSIRSRSAHAAWVALCYHDVQPSMPRAGGGPTMFTTPLASFECMLDTIARNGLIGCSLSQAVSAPSAQQVAITFDDGNIGQYQYAFPALVARGMTATFYITTKWVGQPGFVTWDHLRELAAAGMSVQSHTVSHPFLSELELDQLLIELGESKARLDAELSQDTSEIAFPGGDPPGAGLRYVIEETGYRFAVGSRWGTNRGAVPRGFVRRCTARGEITEQHAQRILNADWSLALRWTAKEATLRRLRSVLGASRYARWRRTLLDAITS